jgi:hypothetical protein
VVGAGLGGAHDHEVAILQAGVAAVEGRAGEAVPRYRAGIAGLREYGARFSVARAIFDMAVFLGPDNPAVRPYLEEGRAILADLRATVLLDRLDALVAAGETPSARGTVRAAEDPTGSALRR